MTTKTTKTPFNPMGDGSYPALRFVGWSLYMILIGFILGAM